MIKRLSHGGHYQKEVLHYGDAPAFMKA